MDGRQPTGVMYVNTHVDDPALEVEYDRWYQDIHFRDVTEPGIFVNATMFHNSRTPPGDGEGKFLAFYESFWQDLEDASRHFSEHVQELERELRIHAGTVGAFFGIYRSHEWLFAPGGARRSQSVIAEHVDCRDPEAAAAAREWYAKERLAAALELGLCHTASIHQLLYDVSSFHSLSGRATPSMGQGMGASGHLALYESELGNPRFIAQRLSEGAPPPPDGVEIRRASSFFRACP